MEKKLKQQKELHIFFFPMLAPGHTIPLLHTAKLFSSSSSATVKSTIITTPLNSIDISNYISASQLSPSQIDIQILQFPSVSGLPEGIENMNQCTSYEMMVNFIKATTLLQEPLERLLGDLRPDCLVADNFFPWATDSAAKFNIPRFAFTGSSFFVMCAEKSIKMYQPFKDVSSDSEPFVLPNLPHQIKLTRSQIIPQLREGEGEGEWPGEDFAKLLKEKENCDLNCYGVIVNSFYELEPDYVNHFKKVWQKNARHVGPLSLCNNDSDGKLVRGKKTAIDESECLKWLDSQQPNSVIYVCFGSEINFSSTQLFEIAVGLESSGQHFIWVVRRSKNEEEMNTWLPEGFEERMKRKGLIIRGWAPQVLILDHEAVGGFVSHCGWNSTMEAVCAGVPMVTWPGFADQFYNERLVIDVLRIGVSVGAKEYARVPSEIIKGEMIERGVKQILVGKEGEEMRRRAKELKDKAKKAVEEGGSSYNDLNGLIDELCCLKLNAMQQQDN